MANKYTHWSDTVRRGHQALELAYEAEVWVREGEVGRGVVGEDKVPEVTLKHP